MDKVLPKLVRGFKIGTFSKKLTHEQATLYAWSVGVDQDSKNKIDLKFLDENNEAFEIIQSYTAQFSVLELSNITKWPGLPKYNPIALLHGGQIIKYVNPLKIGANLKAKNSIIDIENKRLGALVTISSDTFDADDGILYTQNLAKLFISGIGGFSDDPDSEPVTKSEVFPKALSDKAIEEIKLETALNQAHLYRIASGDVNPLHVDPGQVEEGAFKGPILQGLCTLGFSTRAYQSVFDHHKFQKIGVEFVAPTIPGQTLLVKFFDTESADQVWFTTTAYDVGKSKEEGTIVAKGFFHKR